MICPGGCCGFVITVLFANGLILLRYTSQRKSKKRKKQLFPQKSSPFYAILMCKLFGLKPIEFDYVQHSLTGVTPFVCRQQPVMSHHL